MANVTGYSVLCYGTADGYQSNRAQIQLNDGATVLGWVRFHDPDMTFPNDSESAGKIIMHLPTSMFHSVLDMLRNEEPITYYFTAGHAFLGTGMEEVGEEE